MLRQSFNLFKQGKIIKKFCNQNSEYLENLKKQGELINMKQQFQQSPNINDHTYKYFRNLNRIGQYNIVLQEEKKMYRIFNFPNDNKQIKEKIDQQIQYAKLQSTLQQAQQNDISLLNDYSKDDAFNTKFLMVLLVGYLLYNKEQFNFYYEYFYNLIFSDKKEENKDSGKKSSRSRGLLGMVMTDKPEKDIKTRFSDVLGIDEFKEELLELVDFLKNPEKYQEAGAKLPKGILLVGPPGTGKTLLAKALAGESNCSFFYKSGAEFDEVLVGVGASRVRSLFNTAKKHSPSIIFIDEIDSVGGKRNPRDSSFSRETINQILTEMDGFNQSDSVIVIGATNFEQSLDPAIKRAGRFDKIINVPLPDVKGREQIFEYYLQKIKRENNVSAKFFAKATSGFSGADIQNLCNISILNAVKNGRNSANIDDFEFAIDRVSMGIGRSNLLVSEKEKLLTAYHEGGHTLTSLLTDGSMTLHKVTILPRGGALGFTGYFPSEEINSMTKKTILVFLNNLKASIDVAMGGRAAEEIIFGKDDLTSGCSSDLIKATQMAYQYVQQLGMSQDISMISLGDNQKLISDKYKYKLDLEVQQILKESYNRVKTLLEQNQDQLKLLADELIIKETMSCQQVKQLLNLK